MISKFSYIEKPLFREPLCRDDMEGILLGIPKTYLLGYENALVALLECSDDVSMSERIIDEMMMLHDYFVSLLGVSYNFPGLESYRPMLLLCSAEIKKCQIAQSSWSYRLTNDPSLSRKLLDSQASHYELSLNHQIQEFYVDFIQYRIGSCDKYKITSPMLNSGLLGLFADVSVFTNNQDIDDLSSELADIDLLMVRCQVLYNDCTGHGIESPLLNCIASLLLGYAHICRPHFMREFLQLDSIDDYIVMSLLDRDRLMIEQFYGDRAQQVSSTLQTPLSGGFYFKGTHPIISSDIYSDPNDLSQSIESPDTYDQYIGIDIITGEVLIFGNSKEDFECLAFLEEEINMSVISLRADGATFHGLVSPDCDPQDRKSIEEYLCDKSTEYRLITKFDQVNGFVVSIIDSNQDLVEEFVFSKDEISAL